MERIGMSLRLCMLLGMMAVVITTASAKVYSPWILSEQVADTRDEARFAADPQWANLQGQEKVRAVWRYLTDPITGTWRYADTSEGGDPNWECRLVKDPTKTLNVYGYAAGTTQPCLAEGLYEALGFGVRQRAVGDSLRTIEVEWEGAWHSLDAGPPASGRDEKRPAARAGEEATRPEWWGSSAAAVPPLSPQQVEADDGERTAWHWRTLGHTMDFTLRPGESLTRYWKPQGYWRVDPSWAGDLLTELKQPPAGPKTSRDISISNSYGNGKWDYQPVLAPGCSDFAEGVYRSQNTRLYRNGLGLAAAGQGSAEWRFRTPYVIAARPGDVADPADDSGAAVVEFLATGNVALRVSTDQGRTWQVVWSSPKASGAQRVDLTKWVAGRYEYHVCFDLRGSQWQSRISSLHFTTWTQLVPASLPRLKKGTNHLSFVWGDRDEAPTEVLSIEPNFGDPADLKRWGVQVDGPYDPSGIPARARGPVTLRVKALAGTKVRWLHVGGAFNSHHKKPRPDRLLYTTNPAEGWRLLRQETPPDWVQHWYYNLEADLQLNLPVEQLWVRLDPATAANGLRVYAHCAPDEVEQSGPVVVTHIYRMGGKEVKQTFRFDAPRQYEVQCESEPDNVAVVMAVPSRKAKH